MMEHRRFRMALHILTFFALVAGPHFDLLAT
jgi:hypothetical protein